MDALDLVRLPRLMELSQGSADVAIGLVDGPVDLGHPSLMAEHVFGQYLTPGSTSETDPSYRHGTFVAGILSARRGADAPAIAPDCRLFVRPVFDISANGAEPSTAAPRDLAEALVDCVEAGVKIVNFSAARLTGPFGDDPDLVEALRYVTSRGVLVVAAAGNRGTMSSSSITQYPWVIPVISYDRTGLPSAHSNFARSVTLNGLGGPGEGVRSLTPGGGSLPMSGTSAAAPFVAGAAALLWSQFRGIAASVLRWAMLTTHSRMRRGMHPPLLNAWGSYLSLSQLAR